MNIARISRAFIPLRDGISHHTFYLSKHQVMLGHSVWVLQPHHHSYQEGGLHVEKIRLRKLADIYGWKSVTAFFTYLAGLRVREIHRKYGLDLIHGHGDVIEAAILLRFARKLDIPIIMTIHSGLSKKWRYQAVAPHIWRQMDGMVAVSPAIARELEGYGISPERLLVQSSGVDLSRFESTIGKKVKIRDRLGLSPKAFVVVTVGRLTPVKGTAYLIDAIRLADLPNMEVCLIGDGPLREKIQALAGNLPQVRFLGALPQDEVVSYLQGSDLFVLPSMDLPGHVEGTPTAVMEAMAVGLPVIATDSGGTREVIEAIPGVTVVPQCDSRVLAKGIIKLSHDVKLRERLGKSNRKRIKHRDWPQVAMRVCQFYQNIKKLSQS